jgi:hypothetical protein
VNSSSARLFLFGWFALAGVTARGDSPSWVGEALRAIPILNLNEEAKPAVEEPPPGYATPHPAVARIVVPESDGTSYGSGTLVDARGEFGLVVTNWHVVEAARQELWVEFADGFRSAGKLLKVDRDWDLAAIAIWRPNGEPVALAKQAPRPGDELVIAGFGSGPFRAARGQCLQYVTPSLELPLEMVQVTAAARNGDSGGPIFNTRGELAGVLFGTGEGVTSGSYCGRVNEFLASVLPKEPPRPAATKQPPRDLFSAPKRQPEQPGSSEPTTVAPPATVQDFGLKDVTPHASETESESLEEPPTPDEPGAVTPSSERTFPEETSETPADDESFAPTQARQASVTVDPAVEEPISAESLMHLLGDDHWERLKTALALLGLCTLIWHTVRIVGGTKTVAAKSTT